jgi:hypothetical protein
MKPDLIGFDWFNRYTFYPPIIKRGWLANPRRKWRFIAGKIYMMDFLASHVRLPEAIPFVR